MAVQEWIRTERAGHKEANPTALALEEGISTTVAQVLLDGRVLCHGTDTHSWVEWTDARLGVLRDRLRAGRRPARGLVAEQQRGAVRLTP